MKSSKQELLCFVRNRHQLKLDCVNANIFHGTQKSLNDNWTKTGSCELTFMKWSYKGVPIKLTDEPFEYKLNLVPI